MAVGRRHAATAAVLFESEVEVDEAEDGSVGDGVNESGDVLRSDNDSTESATRGFNPKRLAAVDCNCVENSRGDIRFRGLILRQTAARGMRANIHT